MSPSQSGASPMTPRKVDLHVVPVDQEHGERGCWCQHVIDYTDPVSGRRVWVHRRTNDGPHYEDAAKLREPKP